MAESTACALRTPVAGSPVLDNSIPLMCMTIWALITDPPSLPFTVWPDDNIAHVRISRIVPLILQTWFEEADIWPVLLCLRSELGMTANGSFLGM